MRLLIVITTPSYPLWKETAHWQTDPALSATTVKVCSVNNDKVAVICQAVSKVQGDSARTKAICLKTTPWVSEIANAMHHAAANVYVAAHIDHVNLNQVQAEVTGNRFVAGASFHHDCQGLHDVLTRLIAAPDSQTFERAVEAICGKQELISRPGGIGGSVLVGRLNKLKHSIAHLLLPVSIDLQTWAESNFKDEHMLEVLDAYRDDEERLERVRRLLYGTGQPEESDSVQKIVIEGGLENSPAWQKVKALLPRTEPVSEEEKQQAPLYSKVFQTHELLASLREKDKLKRLKAVLETGDNPLNTWYDALEKALAEIRQELAVPPD